MNEYEVMEGYLKSITIGNKTLGEVIDKYYIPQSKLEQIRAEINGLSPIPTAEDVIDGNAVKDAIWEILIEVDKIIDEALKEQKE